MRHAAKFLWLASTFVVAHTQSASNKLAWNCDLRKTNASQKYFDADQQRSINFINSCDIPVQVGFTSGAMCATCSPSQGCPDGGICQLGNCFFPSLLPRQSNPPGNYLRLNPGQQASTSLNMGQLGYGGAVYVSTGCDSYEQSCETGICAGKVCDQFTGPVGPHTRAEFFMDMTDGTDYYDVSLIHGVNVPITMSPRFGVAPVNFTCQTAGGIRGFQDLPGCSYQFNPNLGNEKGGMVNQSSSLVFVAPPNLGAPQPCRGDTDCPSSLRCGLAADRNVDGSPQDSVSRVCGRFVGLWSANEVCVYGQDFDTPFNCQQGTILPGGRNTDLYGCSGPYDFSGYGRGHGETAANVCGCVNWPQPSDQPCNFDNGEWERVAYPWTNLLKKGCPTAYSYPYDDMTSSFRCTPQVVSQPVGYQFEFCPLGTKVRIG
jgi:hypothetical protein